MTFIVTSQNTVSNYANLQDAINAAPAGSVVTVPIGIHVMERLVIPRSICLRGEYATLLGRPAFEGDGWQAIYDYGNAHGSIIVLTATTGIGVDFSGANDTASQDSLTMQNLCIVGSGGTATGVMVGSDTHQKGRIQLSNVTIGNFATGLHIESIYSGSFNDMVICGCQTGVHIHGNAFALSSVDIRSCGTGVLMDGCNSVHVRDGAIQSNDVGVDFKTCQECSVQGVYFEGHTTNAVHIQADSHHNLVYRCHYSAVTDGILIDGSNNRIYIARACPAPIVINSGGNILHDARYGSSNVTISYGNYRIYINGQDYNGLNRQFLTIESINNQRSGLYLKGHDLIAESDGVLYRITAALNQV